MHYYSANGRIRKILMYERKQLGCVDTILPELLYEPIRHKYTKFARSVNRKRKGDPPIDFHVFVPVHRNAKHPVWNDAENHVTFYPVNRLFPGAGISTKWVQDIFLTIPDGNEASLYLDRKRVSRKMGMPLRSLYPWLKMDWSDPASRFSTGGNVIISCPGTDDFLAIEYLDAHVVTVPEYPIPGHIPPGKYKWISMKKVMSPASQELLDSILVHLDLFVTLSGAGRLSAHQAVLHAKCELAPHFVGEDFSDLHRAVRELNGAIAQLAGDLSKKLLLVNGKQVDLPVVIFDYKRIGGKMNPGTGKPTETLDLWATYYNNALVENFTDSNGGRTVRVLMPSYKKIARQYLEEKLKWRRPGEEEEKEWRMLIDKTVDRITMIEEEEIPMKLQEAGVNEYGFVEFGRGFRELSMKFGGLHCLTKVIQRDCQP